MESRPFLTARWESLVLLNYACPPDLLDPLVPSGTTLDRWDGAALVSLVGFMFRDTRVRGVPVPFHRTFEEVNLRFYVRRDAPEGDVRRAVVFVREVVPRRAVAAVARWIYDEPYVRAPMESDVSLDPDVGGDVEYRWRYADRPFALKATARGRAAPSEPGSEAEFITEHYWGYSRQQDGSTLEYRVDHPRWRVWTAETSAFQGDAEPLYGPGFAEILRGPPRSAFVAEGSDVVVYGGHTLERLGR